MSNRREPLLGSLSSLDGLDQHGGDLEQVAADAVVGDLEDRSGLALVHRDDALGILHTGLVLDGAGDAQSNIDLGVNGLAGLTDLMVGGQPARVDGSTGAANDAAQLSSQLLSQLDATPWTSLEIPRPTETTTSAPIRSDQLLGGLDDLDHPGSPCRSQSARWWA